MSGATPISTPVSLEIVSHVENGQISSHLIGGGMRKKYCSECLWSIKCLMHTKVFFLLFIF